MRFLPLQSLSWGLVMILAVATIFAPPAYQYFGATVMIWSIFAIGYNVVGGYAGMMSFGHAAFYGIGAYATAIAITYANVNGFLALGLGALASAILAGVVGVMARRLSGVSLGLTTLAVAQLVQTVIVNRLSEYSGGQEGVTGVMRPVLGPLDLTSNQNFTAFVALVFLLVLALSGLLKASPWGCALSAMRQNEVRAEQIGFDTLMLKIGAFATSGALSGLAGGMLALLMRFTGPEILHWSTSGDILITVLIGGVGTIFGPLAGAFVVTFLRELLSQLTDNWHGILGLVLIFITLYLPQGMAGFGNRFFKTRRTRL